MICQHECRRENRRQRQKEKRTVGDGKEVKINRARRKEIRREIDACTGVCFASWLRRQFALKKQGSIDLFFFRKRLIKVK